MKTYQQMSPSARVWIYQGNRELTEEEIKKIKEKLTEFVLNWDSHKNQLSSSFDIRYNYFIIFVVDQDHVFASGCSIDKSVNLIKSLEKDFHISFFQRENIAYKREGKIQIADMSDFENLLENGIIDEDTIVFNNLVYTKQEMQSDWEIPLKKSWLKKYLISNSK